MDAIPDGRDMTGCCGTAESIAKALGGRKVASSWMVRCPCPGHDDRDASLSIRDADDGKVLFHCHAGCSQNQVIAAFRARGLWYDNGHCQDRFIRPRQRRVAKGKPDSDDATRTLMALQIMHTTAPASGTLAEAYLRWRGVHLPVPATICFHAGLKHATGGTWPAMVALVTRGIDDTPLAIHRTFLARNGAGKAPIQPQKMMLGPCRGGAVRLAQQGGLLMVGEGIETCLAAMQATGYPAWAALSTSGLRTLDLPGDVRDVIVLADGDDPGEAAARDAAMRWKREGRTVRIARPPRGMDFNDMLSGDTPRTGEGAA